MRIVLWCLRVAVFILLLAFALKNTEPVSVRFFFESVWQAPLVIIVLVFFAAGAALGVLLLFGTLFGLRREVARLKRALKDRDNQLTTGHGEVEISTLDPSASTTTRVADYK